MNCVDRRRGDHHLKPKVPTVLSFFLLSLPLMGSSCVNDGFLVSVNLSPIVARFKLGTNTVFAAVTTVKLDSLIPAEYKNKLRHGRIYDFRVKVEGEYGGAVAGAASIRVDSAEAKLILKFPEAGTAPWSAFYTAQSLLGSSPYLSPQADGINELLRALTTSPLPNVTVATLGTLSTAPVPADLYVSVELYLQADAEMN
jgi:hypothetical protein